MAQKKHRLLLGAHTSIATNMSLAFERGASIGCTTIQIFTKSNRQWNAKPITESEAKNFQQTQKKSGIFPVIAHATYLINIGSPDKQALLKSQEALRNELIRCTQLEIPYLVLHPGAHLAGTEQECLDQIIESLDTILEKDSGNTKILLENMAGQGSSVCHKFEQISYIYKKARQKKRLGVCFDTCHAFAAGYDFRTEKTYENMWQEFDKTIGLDNLKAIHLNDSKKECGSRVDRHENIGKGKLGLDPFRFLFNDERFFDIPKILETPEGTLEDYAKDMAVIKSLLSYKTKEILSEGEI